MIADAPLEIVQICWAPTELAGQRQALLALLFGQHQRDQPESRDDTSEVAEARRSS